MAALPVRFTPDGVRVGLITSRETRRWIIPKGWPMKGLRDSKAAAREAHEEAGLLGRVGKEPVGSYLYWKRRGLHFELCRVAVFLLIVERQAEQFREKGQRELRWSPAAEAADLVHEDGLKAIIQGVASLEPS